MKRLRVLCLALLAAAAAALTFVPVPAARAADAATVKERRDKAMSAVLSDGEGLERAKAFADLGVLDDADGAKALAECVTALGVRWTQLETQHAATRKAYEPYSAFNLPHEQKGYWETRRKLLDQMEAEEEKLQAIAVVGQGGTTAVAKLRTPDAVGVIEKLAAAEADLHARTVFWSGLIANAWTNAADLAKKLSADPSAAIRITALEAMALRKEPAFADFAAKSLADPSWPVRKAALSVIAAIGDVKAVPALVAAMQAEDGALLDDYGQVLGKLTGQTHGRHADVWLRWYNENKEVLAKGGVDPAAVKAGTKTAPKPVNLYGPEVVSRRVLFVIDISGSMKEPIGEQAELTGVARKDQPFTGPKIEIAKRVLSEAIEKLEAQSSFNIVFFNHQVQTFQDKMVPASPEMKARAAAAIADLQPAGSTWAYGALRKAFEFAGVTAIPVTGKFDPQADTIFFLSDGAPTDDSLDKAKPMEPEVILDAVKEWNRLAHLKIHVTAIDPRIGRGSFVRFMKGLANQNGGTYTEIGAK